MKTLLVLLLLSVPAFAQKPLEPIRVQVVGAENIPTIELADGVRRELRKRRDVVITDSRTDFFIRVAAGPIDATSRCQGYAAAALIIRHSDKNHSLTVFSATDLGELATFMADEIDRQAFAPRREATVGGRK